MFLKQGVSKFYSCVTKYSFNDTFVTNSDVWQIWLERELYYDLWWSILCVALFSQKICCHLKVVVESGWPCPTICYYLSNLLHSVFRILQNETTRKQVLCDKKQQKFGNSPPPLDSLMGCSIYCRSLLNLWRLALLICRSLMSLWRLALFITDLFWIFGGSLCLFVNLCWVFWGLLYLLQISVILLCSKFP